MKHLKSFNESISREVVKDICLELEDLGMTSEIKEFQWQGYTQCVIIFNIKYKYKQTSYVLWDDVKDCLLRLKKYLGKNFIHCSLEPKKHIQSTIIRLNDDTKIGYPISGISMNYWDR